MRFIYKYELPFQKIGDGIFTCKVDIPMFCTIVHFNRDPNDNFCIWAEVDTENPKTHSYEFTLIGTGRPIPNDTIHLSTIKDGIYMWHLYYRG